MPINETKNKEKNVVQKEPVLTAGAVVAAILALASIFDVSIDPGIVESLVLVALPLVSAWIARDKVTPTYKVEE